ncbi:PEP-CTERM motif protein [Pirellula sp. SH-Sr6A]|uniref:DUF4465 domain-containing protein n=1 Tax=Pirellula sp. SH-Sr6A TaxID=1632865 RepID=UPI00078CB671|nr:DUF4465 domain-containing protein [Pirellula sp. SH-Sr6A]AMV31565.1 PEP-CTERM motif protein [Pirellula sp. SH-Sr6A]
MRLAFAMILVVSLTQLGRADIVVDFEGFPLNGSGVFNGPTSNAISTPGPFGGNDRNGTFAVSGVEFFNSNNDLYGSWRGFAVSNHTDTTTPGFSNQYSSFAGTGANGSSKYAVAYADGAFFNLPSSTLLSSVSLANTTYAALSMQTGDSFAKNFGGVSGNDPDFFRVSLSGFDGLNGTGNSIGSVTVNLADFTFADNSQDFILSNWLTVDLSSIANSRSVSLSSASSDVGAFGINTPTYVAFDNLTITAVPEPSSFALLGIAGTGIALWRRRRCKANSRRLLEGPTS